MDLRLKGSASIAKSFAIKKEKDERDNERVIAHLKVHSITIDRETFDELAGVPIGWCNPWYRDNGEPYLHMSVLLITRLLYVAGKIEVRQEDTSERGDYTRLDITKAKFNDLRFTLDKLGGELSGELIWTAAGDEGESVEDLLGQECAIDWKITDWIEEAPDGQRDMIPPTPLERAVNDATPVRLEADGMPPVETTMGAIRKANKRLKKNQHRAPPRRHRRG